MNYITLDKDRFEIINESKTKDGIDLIEVKNIDRMRTCPKCQSTQIHMYGMYNRKVDHILIDEKLSNERRVKISILDHKYQCDTCHSISSEQYSFVDDATNLSKMFKEFLQKKSFRKPFLKVASEYKVGVTTVKNLFLDAVEEKDKQRQWLAPNILNLCQLMTNPNRSTSTLISDVNKGELLEILSGNDTSELANFICQMKSKNNIYIVVMSIFNCQKEAIENTLRGTPIVVNQYYAIKFVEYIFRLFLKGLKVKVSESVWRKLKLPCKLMLEDESSLSYEVLNTRNIIFTQYPELKDAYKIFKEYKTLFSLDSIKEARDALNSWINNASLWKQDIEHWIDGGIFFEIDFNLVLISQWKDEILEYWKYKRVITESEAHSKIVHKAINYLVKNGRNYSSDVLRGKILYGTPATKASETKPIQYTRNISYPKPQGTMSLYMPNYAYQDVTLTRGFGVNIIELIDFLENNPDFLT